GIETSCDESAIALLENQGDPRRPAPSAGQAGGWLSVKYNIVSSQIEIHKQYGGVVPEVAARAHVPVLAGLIADSGIGPDDVDLIAVTSGPGLITALRVGIDTAKTLSWAWGKPLIGVNHIEGHVYANWIVGSAEWGVRSCAAPVFPALCLVVSGGHTELLLMTGHGQYQRLGETLDDAVGEAFDKSAKLLGLPYPGGPEISKAAQAGDARRYKFPRPLSQDATLNFSFSGLKTAVRVAVGDRTLNPQDVADLAASFQEAAVDSLMIKTKRALNQNREVQSLILAGGVSANQLLRAGLSELAHEFGLPLFLPDLAFTGDNAAMIAAAGYFRRSEASEKAWESLAPESNWQLGEGNKKS
ncbi:MAG: tRNA (adenosine(37)-N6)-threonylcarbamoyltransferase complex transferase subunit TsaD, partial [bacterium]